MIGISKIYKMISLILRAQKSYFMQLCIFYVNCKDHSMTREWISSPSTWYNCRSQTTYQQNTIIDHSYLLQLNLDIIKNRIWK